MSGSLISAIVQKNPSLRYLNLNNNELQDEGVYEIFKGIAKSQSMLYSLDISQNHLKLEDQKIFIELE